MNVPACPNCSKPLAASVVQGPPQAVVRCEQCGNLILWSNGRVVRAAKSTQMGIPVISTPATKASEPVDDEPLPELRPEDDALAELPGEATQTSGPLRKPPPANLAKSPPTASPAVKPPVQPVGAKPAPAPGTKQMPALTPLAPVKTVASPAPKAPAPTVSAPAPTPAKTVTAAAPPAAKTVAAPAPAPAKTVAAPAPAPAKTVAAPAPAPPAKTVSAPAPAPASAPAPVAAKTVTAPSAPAKTITASAPVVSAPAAKTMMAEPARAEPAALPPPPSPGIADMILEEVADLPPVSTQITTPAPAKTVAAAAPPQAKTMVAPSDAGLPPSGPTASIPRSELLPKGVVPSGPTASIPRSELLPPVKNASAEVVALRPKQNYVVLGAVAAVVIFGGVAVGIAVTRPSKVVVPTPIATPTPVPVPVRDPTVKAPIPVGKKPPTPDATKPPAVADRTPTTAPPPVDDEAKPVSKKRLGGRRVVLEYEKVPRAAPVPPADDPETVTKARDAYLRGNARLFSGDAAGALSAYQESLKIYPGYVAGYRGLGLAYAQQGRADEAIAALKTYVRTVPQAKDIPILKHRIDLLERTR